jgi:uncharacterized protein (DUF302 family)
MTTWTPVVTFQVSEPYPTALRMVRRALAQQGLRVPAELDVSARIKQEVGAGVAPCTVLYIDDPVLLLEAIIFQRGAGLLIPQPLVVAGGHGQTEVLLRSAASVTEEGLSASVRDALLGLHSRIVRALETIAERDEVPSVVTNTPASV